MASIPPSSTDADYPDTEFKLLDTDSKLKMPAIPAPHKHQIHVLIIGMSNPLLQELISF